MKIKGFIFDLDGVIVDTAKYHFLAWKKLANSIGVDFDESQNEQLKGVSREKSLEKILSWGDKEISPESFVELMKKKNDDYLGYVLQMTEDEILTDVPRVLDFIINNNQMVALGSASKNAHAILKKVQLFTKFQVIVDGNHVVKGKPDPEVFLKAAEQLNLAPKDCIVFEDSQAGIEAANTANMISIGIGEVEVLKNADYIFNNFTEIKNEFLIELIKR